MTGYENLIYTLWWPRYRCLRFPCLVIAAVLIWIKPLSRDDYDEARSA